MLKTPITKALEEMQKNIIAACHKAHRSPDEVQVLLASKTVDPQNLKVALDLGYNLLGENKVQELKQKADHPLLSTAKWHFIGHLQTNKIKDVIPFVKMIHSVDRMSLAKALNTKLEKLDMNMDVLVQVNTSNEDSKFGLSENEVLPFLESIATLPHLKVKGLMTLALFSDKPELVRPCFKKLKTIFEKAKAEAIPNIEMQDLSMGMSNDYTVAIEEGATIIRLGTAIFGQRPTPDSIYWKQ